MMEAIAGKNRIQQKLQKQWREKLLFAASGTSIKYVHEYNHIGFVTGGVSY
jgi:hypothetical protein